MGEQKYTDFMKKMQQLPISRCTFVFHMQMRKVTIHNNLDPVYTLLKTTELNSQ